MGVMTLADFRTDLQSALGDRGLPDSRLDRWVNQAYLDLAGSIDFETLDANTTTATVGSTQTIAVPSGAAIVKFIRDVTSGRLLGWIPKPEMFRRALTPTGEPLNWSRHDELIYFHPVPSGVFSMFIIYKTMPTAMSSSSDLTVFTSTWDAAVFLLAVHYGLMALAEEERAMAFFGRAMAYIQSRMTEADMHIGASGLGASLPSTMKLLMDKLQQAQVAATAGG